MNLKIKKGTKVTNKSEKLEYTITNLALYEYEQDDETWYEYEMKDKKGHIYYLSIVENEDSGEFFVEISKLIDIFDELPDDDILEDKIKIKGKTYKYIDDYEATITYPFENNKIEEVEIYEYINKKNNKEFLTIEIYDNQEDDFEISEGKIYDIDEIEFKN